MNMKFMNEQDVKIKPSSRLEFKIVLLFTAFILASNFATNYINMNFNSRENISLMKEILIKDLKVIYNYANNQYEIFEYDNKYENAMSNIGNKAYSDFNNKHSITFGLKEDGNIIFQKSKKFMGNINKFPDSKVLKKIVSDKTNKIEDGFVVFKYDKIKILFFSIPRRYYGVYKYNPKWNAFIFRGEDVFDFYWPLLQNLLITFCIIVLITVFCSIIGVLLIQYLLRFVKIISSEIMKMVKKQKLGIIDLKDASYDDVTFLGASFNSLSSSINNLMSIFLKFVNKDIAQKAYKDKEIKLDGEKKELTILFSDIKGFTFMTETLGIDIIKLLNIHYENVIGNILNDNGVIGSIIGDALLAVFGTFDDDIGNKSYHAIKAAYQIQRVTDKLRKSMMKVKEKIVSQKGTLTPLEKKVYKAVLIEIGVGIDGGTVFYGTLGSSSRMTNTVIGDNVNSASRLEGLTRIYKLPVICSEYVKNDVEKNAETNDISFIEIDTVQVKGKTIGKKIYWPVFANDLTTKLKKHLTLFSEGLDLYYQGKWNSAYEIFNKCKLPFIEEFINRTKNYKCPVDWKGIWTMQKK